LLHACLVFDLFLFGLLWIPKVSLCCDCFGLQAFGVCIDIVLLWISGDDFFSRITMSGAGTVGFGIRIRVGEMGWPGGSGVRLHQCLLRNYHDTSFGF
jgi:hypothetical protein